MQVVQVLSVNQQVQHVPALTTNLMKYKITLIRRSYILSVQLNKIKLKFIVSECVVPSIVG